MMLCPAIALPRPPDDVAVSRGAILATRNINREKPAVHIDKEGVASVDSIDIIQSKKGKDAIEKAAKLSKQLRLRK